MAAVPPFRRLVLRPRLTLTLLRPLLTRTRTRTRTRTLALTPTLTRCSDHVPGLRWAGSIINTAVRKLYSHGGGFILRPTETQVMCAYPADGNSQGIT